MASLPSWLIRACKPFGAPMFLLLTPVLTFDSNGELVLSGDVPSGLGPHEIEFQSYAIGRGGKLIASSVRTLTLQ